MALSTIDTSSISALGYGFKNRIINGAMVIDQRNSGASVTQGTGLLYTVDRWAIDGSANSKFTAQQSSVFPTGFVKSLLITSSAATTVGSGDYYYLRQAVEGFNFSDFGWGAAGAQSVTLSFWVRSSLTGTFGGSLRNNDNTRSYPFTYAISAANTWEQKTVTIAGDTSGTWSTTNTSGVQLNFGLGVGSTYSGTAGAWAGTNYLSATGATSVVGTNGATFYITGVQLEKGTVATAFDYRPYGTELQLCQRYYEVFSAGSNTALWTYASAPVIFLSQFFNFAVPKRATPTGTATFSSSKFVIAGTVAVDGTAVHTVNTYSGNTNGFSVQVNAVASVTASSAATYTYEGTFQIFSSAEL